MFRCEMSVSNMFKQWKKHRIGMQKKRFVWTAPLSGFIFLMVLSNLYLSLSQLHFKNCSCQLNYKHLAELVKLLRILNLHWSMTHWETISTKSSFLHLGKLVCWKRNSLCLPCFNVMTSLFLLSAISHEGAILDTVCASMQSFYEVCPFIIELSVA